MALRRFLFIVAAFTIVVLLLAVWFLPDYADFRIENGSWNGLSQFENSSSIQPLASLEDLPASPGGSFLIIIPYLDFTAAELEKIGRYITDGGSIVLADDYGYGNRVLAYLGLKARFSGQALLDPLINYKNEYFPRVISFKPDPLTDSSDNLVLNHATSLVNIDPENVLARSSSFSFLDENGSGTYDEGDTSGPLPVIARQQIGNSQIVLIADPSIFINSMTTMGGNASFIENISAASASLYFDQSHLDTSDLGHTRSCLVTARSFLGSPIGTVLLVGAIVVATLAPMWQRRKASGGAIRLREYLSNILKRS